MWRESRAPWCRTLGAIVELSQTVSNCRTLQRKSLEVLQKEIGYDVAFFCVLAGGSGTAPPSAILDGVPPFVIDRTDRRGAAYAAELTPVIGRALQRQGVTIDTEVLGSGVRSTCYYREIVEPSGGRHSLLCKLELRGKSLGVIMLGRGPTGFHGRDLDHMRALRPVLSLAVASFASRAPSERREDDWARQHGLTLRQREIGSYVCLGYTNREIATALGTSENTVRNQLAVLFQKVDASTRAELAGLWPRG